MALDVPNSEGNNAEAEKGGIVKCISRTIGRLTGVFGKSPAQIPATTPEEDSADSEENSSQKSLKAAHKEAEPFDPTELKNRYIGSNRYICSVDPYNDGVQKLAGVSCIHVMLHNSSTSYFGSDHNKKESALLNIETQEVMTIPSGQRIYSFNPEPHIEMDGKKYHNTWCDVGTVLVDPETLECPKTTTGEEIRWIHSDHGKVTFEGREYLRANLMNGPNVYVDPISAEILTTASGERIMDWDHYYGGTKLLKKVQYILVRLVTKEKVLLNPETFEILTAASGEWITSIYNEKQIKNTEYANVDLVESGCAALNLETLEEARTASGEKIQSIDPEGHGVLEVKGKNYIRILTENGYAMLNVETFKPLETEDGEKVSSINSGIEKIGNREYVVICWIERKSLVFNSEAEWKNRDKTSGEKVSSSLVCQSMSGLQSHSSSSGRSEDGFYIQNNCTTTFADDGRIREDTVRTVYDYVDPTTFKVLETASGGKVQSLYRNRTATLNGREYVAAKKYDDENIVLDVETFEELQAKEGENISSIPPRNKPRHVRRVGSKEYQEARLNDQTCILLDPETLDSVKTDLGQRIEYQNKNDGVSSLSLFAFCKLGDKEYLQVPLKDGGSAVVEPETMRQLITAEGEEICAMDKTPKLIKFEGKNCKEIVLKNGDKALVDVETLELIKTPEDKMITGLQGVYQLNNGEFTSINLDGEEALIDTTTSHHLKTPGGDKIMRVGKMVKLRDLELIHAVLENNREALLNLQTLEPLTAEGKIISDVLGVYKLDDKEFWKVTYAEKGSALLDADTFKELKTPSGENIINIWEITKMGNTEYLTAYAGGFHALILPMNPRTFKPHKTTSGEAIISFHSNVHKLGGRRCLRAKLENEEFVMLDLETLEVMETASGEAFTMLSGDEIKIEEIDDRKYMRVIFEEDENALLDTETLHIRPNVLPIQERSLPENDEQKTERGA